MNFFKKSSRSPAELVRDVRVAIAKLDSPTLGSDGRRKVSWAGPDWVGKTIELTKVYVICRLVRS